MGPTGPQGIGGDHRYDESVELTTELGPGGGGDSIRECVDCYGLPGAPAASPASPTPGGQGFLGPIEIIGVLIVAVLLTGVWALLESNSEALIGSTKSWWKLIQPVTPITLHFEGKDQHERQRVKFNRYPDSVLGHPLKQMNVVDDYYITIQHPPLHIWKKIRRYTLEDAIALDASDYFLYSKKDESNIRAARNGTFDVLVRYAPTTDEQCLLKFSVTPAAHVKELYARDDIIYLLVDPSGESQRELTADDLLWDVLDLDEDGKPRSELAPVPLLIRHSLKDSVDDQGESLCVSNE